MLTSKCYQVLILYDVIAVKHDSLKETHLFLSTSCNSLMSKIDQVFIFAAILGTWWHFIASADTETHKSFLVQNPTDQLNSSGPATTISDTVYFSNRTTWTNNNEDSHYILQFTDKTIGRFLLLSILQESNVSFLYMNAYGLGFHRQQTTDDHSCRMAILCVDLVLGGGLFGSYEVVWSANPNNLVGENATLELASSGNLVLKDAAGSPVWWSGTPGEHISHMTISTSGNWGLFSPANRALWQSFDYPTDTLLLGQWLDKEQHLSSANGLFYLKMDQSEICAYADGRNPVKYFTFAPAGLARTVANLTRLEFSSRGKLTFVYSYLYSLHLYPFQFSVTIRLFFRLDNDGGVRVYGWEPILGWKVIYVFGWDECQFPLKCGSYGICQSGQCTCPVGSDGTEYFTPLNPRLPSQGCLKKVPVVALGDKYSQHELVKFPQLSYNILGDNYVQMENEERCKEVCAANASCNGAVFDPTRAKGSKGLCFFLDDVLSLVGRSDGNFFVQLYLKVQVSSPQKMPMPIPHHKRQLLRIAIMSVVLLLALSVTLGVLCYTLFMKKQRRIISDKMYAKGLSEAPLLLSYDELRVATRNFSEILGEGGFGVVFKGVLKNGTGVAVKRLKKAGQGMDGFFAEMETLGTIHHINLVSLVGFCADRKQNHMLVYEYMSGGSLDKWIFCDKTKSCLDWNTKKKILLDIARGLAYLHQECRQKIAHLDVKPQNILLDGNLNSKLSDFGLSKLINRDQSEVITHVRGTLGYLAPEWQQGRVTVKADVYSYGVVVIEVITGRKILDFSQELEAHLHLPGLLQEKAAESRLIDIVDLYCGYLDLESERDEAVAMIKLGMWCLNINYTKRPTMDLVVKFLEGVLGSAPDAACHISPSKILNCIIAPPC